MDTKDIKIGLRVRVLTNDLIAVVVGDPEFYKNRTSLTRIKYENSTRFEHMINHQLTALPKSEQYEGVGGDLKPNKENNNG